MLYLRWQIETIGVPQLQTSEAFCRLAIRAPDIWPGEELAPAANTAANVQQSNFVE